MGGEKTIGVRVARYAYRFWMRAGMTAWPTVQQAARSLGIRQQEIEDWSGNEYSLLAYYTCPKATLAEHFIEADTPEVETAWTAYWAPYSRPSTALSKSGGDDGQG